VVAAEDASFFAHEGFDWEGIKDAALYNLEVGEFKRGGSTITQQFAKNLYLSSERSLLRKAREALITRSLEHHLTKERILGIVFECRGMGAGRIRRGSGSAAPFREICQGADDRRSGATGSDSSLPAPV
jgi:monofunctional biosynthetic peptidoglycan transglycosylase